LISLLCPFARTLCARLPLCAHSAADGAGILPFPPHGLISSASFRLHHHRHSLLVVAAVFLPVELVVSASLGAVVAAGGRSGGKLVVRLLGRRRKHVRGRDPYRGCRSVVLLLLALRRSSGGCLFGRNLLLQTGASADKLCGNK